MRGLSLVCLFLSPLGAVAQERLAWKFATGDVFFLQRDSQEEQITTLKERTLKQAVQRNITFRIEVVDGGSDRVGIKLTFETIQAQHLSGKASVENKLLERMRGATLPLEVTAQGKIKSLAGYDAFVAQVSEKKDELAKVVRQLWPEALLQQEFEEMLGVLPDRTVKVGEKWEEKGTLLLPPLGSFAVQRHKAYPDIDRAGHAHLVGTLTGTYQLPAQPADLFRVVKGELALTKAGWECTFDRGRGRILRARKQLEVQGPLTVELMGMATAVDLTLRSDVVTKLLSKEP